MNTLRFGVPLMTEQRRLNARPVEKDSAPAEGDGWNFPGCPPIEQGAAAHRQPGQKLLFTNEISATFRRVLMFAIHSRANSSGTEVGPGAIIAQNDTLNPPCHCGILRRRTNDIALVEHDKPYPL